MIPFSKTVVNQEMKDAALRVLSGEDFLLGEEVEQFEKEFANYCGAKYAISVSSGTASLHLSVLSSNVSPGDEVITVSNSFISTANCILYAQAKPVFVDIDTETYNIDPTKVEEKITTKTKAVIPVHLYGHPADMDTLQEIAEKYDLKIIEDACQAHGAVYKGKKVGFLGDIGCFSFGPTKGMTVCGDGGMVVTNDVEKAEKIRMMRDYGRIAKRPYKHEILGFNLRLSEIHAAIGRVQLKKLPKWIERKRKNAANYLKLLEELPGIIIPSEKSWASHVYTLYVIRCKYRDLLRLWLRKFGIQAVVHYPLPIHLQPFYSKRFNYHKNMLPITEKYSTEVLTLPMYPSMNIDEIERVVQKIDDFQRKFMGNDMSKKVTQEFQNVYSKNPFIEDKILDLHHILSKIQKRQ